MLQRAQQHPTSRTPGLAGRPAEPGLLRRDQGARLRRLRQHDSDDIPAPPCNLQAPSKSIGAGSQPEDRPTRTCERRTVGPASGARPPAAPCPKQESLTRNRSQGKFLAGAATFKVRRVYVDRSIGIHGVEARWRGRRTRPASDHWVDDNSNRSSRRSDAENPGSRTDGSNRGRSGGLRHRRRERAEGSLQLKPTKLDKKKYKNIKLREPDHDVATSRARTSRRRRRGRWSTSRRSSSSTTTRCRLQGDRRSGLASAPDVADAKQMCGQQVRRLERRAARALRFASRLVRPATTARRRRRRVQREEQGAVPVQQADRRASRACRASVLIGKLKKSHAGKQYGQALDVTIPPLAAGAISVFKVTIPKSKYVQAKCKSKKIPVQATTYFDRMRRKTHGHRHASSASRRSQQEARRHK